MPRKLVKQAWTGGIQDPEALAFSFRVSVESMRIRLTYLGFLDDPQRPVETLFRMESLVVNQHKPLNRSAA